MNKPTKFEVWLFKWLFLPSIILYIGYGIYTDYKSRGSCEVSCLKQGHEMYKFVPKNIRSGKTQSSCHCGK